MVVMENLHKAIRHLYDDFTMPSARGQATTLYPGMWDVECHANAAMYDELKARGYDISEIDECVAKPRPKQEKPDTGMEIDWKALHDMMEDFIYALPETLVKAELKCSVIESVLVSIARKNDWAMTDPSDYRYGGSYCPRVYKIR